VERNLGTAPGLGLTRGSKETGSGESLRPSMSGDLIDGPGTTET
jgi:hypothetical protein